MSDLYFADWKLPVYGTLSNNYPLSIEFDNTRYSNITSLVYANTLANSELTRVVSLQEDPQSARMVSESMYKTVLESTTKQALETSLWVKFLNPGLRDALAATGVSVLVYRSDNTYMGVDEAGNGLNTVGSILMDIRKRITGPKISEAATPPIDFKEDQNDEYGFLAVNTFYGMLDISGLLYPTPNHYVINVLLVLVGTFPTMASAHTFLMAGPDPANPSQYKNPSCLQVEFDQVRIDTYTNRLRKFCVFGVDSKMGYMEARQKLIASENKELVYNDYNDSALGIGPMRNGQNFLGTYLMEYRQRLAEANAPRVQIPSETHPIAFYCRDNADMVEWIRFRQQDITQSILTVIDYLSRKGVNVDLYDQIADFVISSLYGQCDTQPEHIPVVPVDLDVTSQLMDKSGNSTVFRIWKYLYSLIRAMDNVIDDSDFKRKLQFIVDHNQSTVECSGPFPEATVNCIVKACAVLSGKLQYAAHSMYNVHPEAQPDWDSVPPAVPNAPTKHTS